MFEVFVDILALHKESSIFAAFINSGIRLEIQLFKPKPHHLAVVLVHFDKHLREETWFRATCCRLDLNLAILAVCVHFRYDNLNYLISFLL